MRNGNLGPVLAFFVLACGVDDAPVVVLVTVWIEGNLLLCGIG